MYEVGKVYSIKYSSGSRKGQWRDIYIVSVEDGKIKTFDLNAGGQRTYVESRITAGNECVFILSNFDDEIGITEILDCRRDYENVLVGRSKKRILAWDSNHKKERKYIFKVDQDNDIELWSLDEEGEADRFNWIETEREYSLGEINDTLRLLDLKINRNRGIV